MIKVIFKSVAALIVALVAFAVVQVLGNSLITHQPLNVEAYKPAVAGDSGKAAAAAPAKELPLGERLAAASADAGKDIAKKCAACHDVSSAGTNKVGPGLAGVVGRKKGSKEGFAYSAAVQGLGGTWTYQDLDSFLTKPSAFAAGTKMTFAGLSKPEDRANVIAFLKSLSPNAPAFPQ